MSMYAKLPEKINKTFAFLPERSRILVEGHLSYLINRRFSPSTILTAMYHLHTFCQHLPDHYREDLCQVRCADIRAFYRIFTWPETCGLFDQWIFKRFAKFL
jgi:hypothetical protein